MLDLSLYTIVLYHESTGGSDFVADEEMLVLDPENATLSILIPILDDDVFELTETLQAVLSFPGTPPPRVTISQDITSIAILDDDCKLMTKNVSSHFITCKL